MEPTEQLSAAESAPSPWYAVWATALTRPNLASYEALASQPQASLSRASLWVFLSATLAGLISLAVTLAFPSLSPFPTGATEGLSGSSAPYLVLLCMAPFLGAMAVLGLYISAGISHVIARALGGIGEFRQLAFVMAAYTSPISIVSSIMGAIPLVNLLVLPITLFTIYLNILAIKAVHRFSWGRAVVSSVLFLAGILFAISCLLIGVLVLMGPAIGSVFSNIISDLGTPTP